MPTSSLVVAAALLAPAVGAGQAAPTSGAPPGPGAARPAGAAPADLPAILADADAAYARRDEPGQEALLRERLEAAERAAPSSYDVLWRLARFHVWLADDPDLGGEEKSRRGKRAWEYAEKAIAANPDGAEGWFYAAAGMGNYSLGIGILKALSQGIEGKFKDRLSHAERLRPDLDSGAIPTAWGRFWFKLPWPKYDAKKSRRALEQALKMNPENVRAHVYLAELHDKEDRKDEARAEWERAAVASAGSYDPPEARRWQRVARARLAAPPEKDQAEQHDSNRR
jgi:tetratricopeptide (TPR) repeat protein